ncbi:T9SS type A sorting domain-containing protein [Porifericola rhodea]|uniref:T9SS type A sorting domain-containing protein n=1 Tax=Porifericola rhodea TaxID=930972 RepID=UPI0026670848|nr:T9SS type A sorting domain-containing protein [Porifericola rhodea]WKN32569.1 T9SS type A sorting domain-containing protein [Porifericola rhodea]
MKYVLSVILTFVFASAWAQNACNNRSTFNWDDHPGDPRNQTYADEGVDFTFTLSDPNNRVDGADFEVDGTYQFIYGVNSLRWEQNLANNTESSTITVDFNNIALNDFCFYVLGINNNDVITVSGSFNSNNVTFSTTEVVNEAFRYCFNGPVDEISVTFSSNAGGNPPNQIVGLWNFEWCDIDFDDDGIRDAIDLDSDNDGLLDTQEDNNAAGDSDNDGIPDYSDPSFPGYTDADANNVNDNIDMDGDGYPNSLDIDSDGDGIPDNIEGPTTAAYIAPTGNDTDNDGLDDAYDSDNGGSTVALVDTDGDGTNDYLDQDSDGDGVSDLIEGNDIDFNGLADLTPDTGGNRNPSGTDADGDGLDDSFDVIIGRNLTDNPTVLGRNTIPESLLDANSEYNFRDTDDDGDGVLTSAELTDTNGDGIPEYIQACGDGSILDFDDYTVGSTPGPFNIDGVTITFEFSDASGNVLSYTVDRDELDAANNIYSENYVRVLQNLDNASQYSLLKVKFNRPLKGFRFNLLDIDKASPQFTDYLSVNVYSDADVIVLDGNNILPGRYNRLNDNNFIEGLNNTNDEDYFGNVHIAIGQTVDSLVIRYANLDAGLNGGNNNQAVGLGDFTWCGIDSDFDEVLDFVDNDDNNNGILDIIEAGGTEGVDPDPSGDADGDKIPNYQDPDFAGFTDVNADGIDDNYDYDLDGIPDHLDKDTDNDGLPDAVEANGGTLPENMDTDGSYSAAYVATTTDADGDGIIAELDPDEGGTALPVNNSDNDAVNDFRDLDSDNDGIADLVEAGGTDTNGDGQVDDFVDVDTDGMADQYDPDSFAEGLLEGSLTKKAKDTDRDGYPNYRDADSDADGITDNVEAQTTAGYVAAGSTDTDGDGWLDEYDSDNGGTPISLVDNDGDGTQDYIDTDSDGDGVLDRIEARDANRDGRRDINPANNDTDQDGLDDNYDPDNGGTLAPLLSSDTDLIPDYRDIDDDNDGILTQDEDSNANGRLNDDFAQGGGSVPDYLYNTDDPDSDNIVNDIDQDDNNDGIPDIEQGYGVNPGADADNDGTPNYLDTDFVHPTYGAFVDANGDGVNDTFDTDRDGVPNHFDLDSDGDGIPNAVEANDGILPPNMTENGQYDYAYVRANDHDGDGLVNDLDPDFGGTPLSNSDFDGDGLPDALDQDADGDGIPDAIEAQATDTNNNGVNDTYLDSDGDGNADYRDSDADNDGITDAIEGRASGVTASGNDTDLDGLDDAFDPDNGGAELTGYDHDNDGTPDYLDSDSDNDGIADIIEGNDADGNGVADANLSNVDSDGDGIDNNFEGGVALQNTDSNGEPDFRDVDDDGDGIPTADESLDQSPANGTPDYLEASSELCGPGFTAIDRYGDAVAANNGGTRSNAAVGAPNYNPATDNFTAMAYTNGANQYIILDLGENVPEGRVIEMYVSSNQAGSAWRVQSSLTGAGFGNTVDYTGLVQRTNIEVRTYTVPAGGIRYIAFIWNAGLPYIDGVVFESCILDTDNDEIADINDNDSDNDGLSDAQEGNGIDPTADADGDGIANYLDSSFAGFEDLNGDGVNDNFDFDLDGIANHLDLDSDNDGIPDAVEANNGSLPANMTNEGTYLISYVLANDTDGDGYANDVDASNGGTALANPDTDGDGLNDFTDRDSDNDGITDTVEAGGTDNNRDGIIDNFADTDGDGLADLVDTDNGGTQLTIINTDGTDNPDYIDTDSDNDSGGGSPGLPDLYEAHDSDFDGTPSWDDNGNLLLDPNEGNVDLDGDGILDAFDPSEGGIGASLPDVDKDGVYNYRDDDDDDDGIPTSAEDANGDGNFFNDFSEGQDTSYGGRYSFVPDYLYNPLSPLPVDLVSFEAYWDSKVVMLEWETASEKNNDYFEVERSDNGYQYTAVGKVKGKGTTDELSTYSYADEVSSNGEYFYRLKQVDFDGAISYSLIRYVKVELSTTTKVDVYPNPTTDYCNVVVEGVGGDISYTILDLSGRSLQRGSFQKAVKLDLQRMNTGSYIIQLYNVNFQKAIQIVKK